ncbi:MAG: 50S ribosomal protein L25 [Actinomycetota bacterium]
MQQETLRATERVTSGSRASRRLRRDGRVPAVVYGTNTDTRAVHVASRELYGVLRTEAGLNAIIELDIEGSTLLAIAREIQRDPIRGDISHLDFIEVRLDTEIDAEVGIDYIGTPEGVKNAGAIVETLEASIVITALPNAIPSVIEIDIEHLELHDTLKVADLPVIEGVVYTLEPDHPLLTVVLPAAEIEPEVELLEGEEGEELEADEDEEADSAEDEG